MDTSALLAVVLNEPPKARLIELTDGWDLSVPAAFPYEAGNALTAMVKRGRLDATFAMSAWRALTAIAVDLIEVDIERAVRLAIRHGIYAYDA